MNVSGQAFETSRLIGETSHLRMVGEDLWYGGKISQEKFQAHANRSPEISRETPILSARAAYKVL
jgi:hypothetical protein